MLAKHWRAVGASLAVLLVTAQTAEAGTQPSVIMARAGADYDQRAADQARCAEVAGAAPVEDLPASGSRASAAGYGGYGGEGGLEVAVGAAIAFAIIAAIDTHQARGKAQIFCMANLGYVGVPLTAAEAAEYDPLRGRRRADWERAFLSRDLGDRVAPLLAPAVPPLPPYRAEPATQGGLKFDLASLTAAEGPVAAGGAVATGKVTRWRTAELARPFETTTGPLILAGAPGAVFHQVDYRPQRDPLLRDQGATWCGPVTETGATGAATQVWCFSTHAGGYDVFRPTGYAWLAGPYRDGIVLPRHTAPIVLTEREADDLGPLDFQILAPAITRTRVTLQGVVKHAGRQVTLWRQEVRLEPGGSVTLPMWSRRVVITRTGDALTAVVDDQGTGEGLR